MCVCALRYSVLNVSGKLGFWFSVRCDLQVIHSSREITREFVLHPVKTLLVYLSFNSELKFRVDEVYI